jgi:formate hydrogenlyase subunit 3/multisubunit Na+/H+ antiporter MnhD subunit
MPWTAGLFAVGILALIGLPPFGLFVSEFALSRGICDPALLAHGKTLMLLVVYLLIYQSVESDALRSSARGCECR